MFARRRGATGTPLWLCASVAPRLSPFPNRAARDHNTCRMAVETQAQQNALPSVTREQYDAVLFDLDGVLTSTAAIHASAWKRMFDDYLRELSLRAGDPREPRYRPFEIDDEIIDFGSFPCIGALVTRDRDGPLLIEEQT